MWCSVRCFKILGVVICLLRELAGDKLALSELWTAAAAAAAVS